MGIPRIINGKIDSTGVLTLDDYNLGYPAESNATVLSIPFSREYYGYDLYYECELISTKEKFRSFYNKIAEDTKSDETTIQWTIPYFVVRNPGKILLQIVAVDSNQVVWKTNTVECFSGLSVNAFTDDHYYRREDVLDQLEQSKADNLSYTNGALQLIANKSLVGNSILLVPSFDTYEKAKDYAWSVSAFPGERVNVITDTVKSYIIDTDRSLLEVKFADSAPKYDDLINKPILDTTTDPGKLSPDRDEVIEKIIKLSKVSKTGRLSDTINDNNYIRTVSTELNSVTTSINSDWIPENSLVSRISIVAAGFNDDSYLLVSDINDEIMHLSLSEDITYDHYLSYIVSKDNNLYFKLEGDTPSRASCNILIYINK